jgi:hypothetical protein
MASQKTLRHDNHHCKNYDTIVHFSTQLPHPRQNQDIWRFSVPVFAQFLHNFGTILSYLLSVICPAPCASGPAIIMLPCMGIYKYTYISVYSFRERKFIFCCRTAEFDACGSFLLDSWRLLRSKSARNDEKRGLEYSEFAINDSTIIPTKLRTGLEQRQPLLPATGGTHLFQYSHTFLLLHFFLFQRFKIFPDEFLVIFRVFSFENLEHLLAELVFAFLR